MTEESGDLVSPGGVVDRLVAAYHGEVAGGGDSTADDVSPRTAAMFKRWLALFDLRAVTTSEATAEVLAGSQAAHEMRAWLVREGLEVVTPVGLGRVLAQFSRATTTLDGVRFRFLRKQVARGASYQIVPAK